MSKRFPTFGPYNVIADTNALRATDERRLVSQGFETALAELRKETKVHLCIPEVVLGELAFQKCEMAYAAINQASSKLKLLGEITGAKQPTIFSFEHAKRKIRFRYNDWCKTHEAKVCAPRVGHTLWKRIVEEAVWRIPPFERAGDRGHEKGFRDRIVLETVIQFCAKNDDETVFLTGDTVLTEALVSRKVSKLSIHPKLQDFTSRIRLRKKDATKEWVELLFAAATRAFYAADAPDCIYRTGNIYDKIVTRVDDLLPPPSDSPYFLTEPSVWERSTDERIRVGATRFDKGESSRFFWVTEVHSAAAFAGKGFLNVTSEKIRISTFTVHWSSKNTAVAEIQEPTKIENIALVSRTMVDDTNETRATWNLPLKATPILPQPSVYAEMLKLLPGTGQQ